MPKIINAAMGQRASASVEPTWEERSLVFRMPSQRVYVEDGWRYGELFVHASLPGDPDLVVVSHVATRLAILRVHDVEDAIAGAEVLWSECRGAWRYCDDVDLSKIPQRIIDWVKECNRQRKLVPLT